LTVDGQRPADRGRRRERNEEAGRHGRARPARPPLTVFPTTLWEYPSQHYDAWVDEDGRVVRSRRPEAGAAPRGRAMQGDKSYAGATPSWVIWQCLMRYTRRDDLVVDPMCGSGTTIDVATDLGRRSAGFDLSPSRPDILPADARRLPLPDAAADFVFIDPPYSTHIAYSDRPEDIGRLDASPDSPDGGRAYYGALRQVIGEAHRVLKDRRYMAVYVSDSWRKRRGEAGGVFMPIGFEVFAILRERFRPVDIVAVVRGNEKLSRGNWRRAAVEGNFFLRGFNYLLIMKKQESPRS
jgi:DNA modification methylase